MHVTHEDDLTAEALFRSGDDAAGSEAIISAIRDIINADMAMLETDPEEVMISQRAEARLRAALSRLTGSDDTPPTVLEALVLEALAPLLRDWLERNLGPLVERLVEAEIRRIMADGVGAKQLEADDAVV
jgi:cell pole-organizing protein PopZ